MIQPIITYGSEIWGCFGCSKQTRDSTLKCLLSIKHRFERIHIKTCKQILGLSNRSPDIMALSELGRFPIMGNIVKNIVSYWQHTLHSPKGTLINEALNINIGQDRNGKISYYTRIKQILDVLNTRNSIYMVKQTYIKKYSQNVRTKLCKEYEQSFFKQINRPNANGSYGRYEVYRLLKKNYTPENYIHKLKNNYMRRNITHIRTSTHCLPIESLRKKNIPRTDRLCNLCNIHVGSELHVLMMCQNSGACSLRDCLKKYIYMINPEISKLNENDLFIYLLLAIDDTISFYFAIFLKKIFTLIKLHTN